MNIGRGDSSSSIHSSPEREREESNSSVISPIPQEVEASSIFLDLEMADISSSVSIPLVSDLEALESSEVAESGLSVLASPTRVFSPISSSYPGFVSVIQYSSYLEEAKREFQVSEDSESNEEEESAGPTTRGGSSLKRKREEEEASSSSRLRLSPFTSFRERVDRWRESTSSFYAMERKRLVQIMMFVEGYNLSDESDKDIRDELERCRLELSKSQGTLLEDLDNIVSSREIVAQLERHLALRRGIRTQAVDLALEHLSSLEAGVISVAMPMRESYFSGNPIPLIPDRIDYPGEISCFIAANREEAEHYVKRTALRILRVLGESTGLSNSLSNLPSTSFPSVSPILEEEREVEELDAFFQFDEECNSINWRKAVKRHFKAERARLKGIREKYLTQRKALLRKKVYELGTLRKTIIFSRRRLLKKEMNQNSLANQKEIDNAARRGLKYSSQAKKNQWGVDKCLRGQDYKFDANLLAMQKLEREIILLQLIDKVLLLFLNFTGFAERDKTYKKLYQRVNKLSIKEEDLSSFPVRYPDPLMRMINSLLISPEIMVSDISMAALQEIIGSWRNRNLHNEEKFSCDLFYLIRGLGSISEEGKASLLEFCSEEVLELTVSSPLSTSSLDGNLVLLLAEEEDSD